MVKRDRNTKRIALKQIIPTIIGGCCAFSMFSVGFSSWVVTVEDRNTVDGTIVADDVQQELINCFTDANINPLLYDSTNGFVTENGTYSTSNNVFTLIDGSIVFKYKDLKTKNVISSLDTGFSFQVFIKNNTYYSVDAITLNSASISTINSDNVKKSIEQDPIYGQGCGININLNNLSTVNENITLYFTLRVKITTTFNNFVQGINKQGPQYVFRAGELL